MRVKSTSGVTTIIPGQAMKSDLSFKNTGNVPRPAPTSPTRRPPGPPFDVVRLVNLSASRAAPTHVLEVFDPDRGHLRHLQLGNAALLLRATGIGSRHRRSRPGTTFHVSYNVMLRDNPTPPVGTTFNNCAQIGNRWDPEWHARVRTDDHREGRRGQREHQQVDHPGIGSPAGTRSAGAEGHGQAQIQNNGPAYLKRLILTDTDTDFFDAVDFGANMRVNFRRECQPGADRRLHQRRQLHGRHLRQRHRPRAPPQGCPPRHR